VLKCRISLRFPSLEHFISHGIPSSLKASFESANKPMNFSQEGGPPANPRSVLAILQAFPRSHKEENKPTRSKRTSLS